MSRDYARIVVVADICGKWDAFHTILLDCLSTNPDIKFCFAIGTCFGANHGLDSFLNGNKTWPIPVYLVCGEESENGTALVDGMPNGGDILPNMSYMGRFGIKVLGELRICYLSGIHGKEHFLGEPNLTKYSNFYTAKDLKSIQVNFKDCDVLLTTEWPSSVHKNIISVDLPTARMKDKWENIGSPVVQSLSTKASPRVHFAAFEKVFFAPRPHRNHDKPQCTHFVGLADFQNQTQQEYMFASKIMPFRDLTTVEIRRQSALDVRPCPFPAPAAKRRKLLTNNLVRPPEGYMCGLCGSVKHWFRACPRYKEPSEFRKLQEQVYGVGNTQKGCGYCFHSQGVSKHLIVSVGLHCYLTVSRTPVVPDHFLIVPNDHTRSSAEFNGNQKKEVEMFLNALAKCFNPQVLLIFERNIKISKHGFVEVVPIVRGQLAQLGSILRSFEKSYRMIFHKIDTDVDLQDMIGQYGFLSMGTSEGERYLHVVDPTKPKVRSDVLRRMVYRIMGFQETYNYAKQRISKADQTKSVALIKERFSPYDPFTDKRYSVPTFKQTLKIKKNIVLDGEGEN